MLTGLGAFATSMRQRWSATLAIAASLVLFFAPAVFGERTFFARDTLRMHAAIRTYASERLRAGQLPLWWSHEGMGAPFAAQGVTAVFHPLALLVTPLSAPLAIKWMTLLAYLAGALGTYALARRLALAKPSATFAALAYTLSGYLVSVSDNWTYLAGACTLPWVLVGADRLARGKWWHLDLTALALACLLLGGDYHMAYAAGLAAGAWILACADGWRAKLTSLGGLALASLLAAALAAIQLLGSAELLAASSRASGMSTDEALRWSLHPWRLLELFAGPALPADSSLNVSKLLLGDPLRGLWARGIGWGAIVVGMALAALTARPRRHPRGLFLSLFAAAGLLLALGRFGGLYSLALQFLPLWKAFRFPEKMLPLAGIAVALLAAIGLEQSKNSAKSRALLLLAGLLSLVAAYLSLFPGSAEALLAEWGRMLATDSSDSEPARQQAAAAAVGAARGSLLLSAEWCAASGALGWLLSRRRPGTVKGVLAAAALLQLAWQSKDYYELTPLEMYQTEPPFVEPLRGHADGSQYRMLSATGDESLAVVEEGLSRYEGLSMWEKATLSPDFNAPFGLNNINPYLPGALTRLAMVREGARRWALQSSLYSVRYLIVRKSTYERSPLPPPAQVIAQMDRFDLVLVDLVHSIPRTYLACPEPADSAAAALRRVLEPRFPAGLRVALETTSVPPCEPETDGLGSARVLQYEPERVLIEVEANAPAVLVLNDAYYPGWNAQIDGNPMAVFPANVAARGVLVPAGHHEVEFNYKPQWLVPGALVSIAAWLLLAAMLGVQIRLLASARP